MNRGLIILDRDGVINQESSQFVKTPAEWVPLEGSIAAIAALSQAGFVVAIASNQSGLARGLFNRAALRAMHRKLRRLVAAAGGRIDRIEVCPHGPDDGCSCRKPKPGLLYRLSRRLSLDVAGAPVIGDSLRDLEAARKAGARPILVRTGNGRQTEAALRGSLANVEVFDDLAAAANALLKE